MKPKAKKTVLLLSYYWPPSGGSGVQRWMYFAKYLQRLDWDITVITVDPKLASYPVVDYSLVRHVDTIKTYKTKTREPFWLYRKISGRSKQNLPQGEINTKGIFNKIYAFIRGNFFIPDARIGWNKFAFKKATEILKEESFSYLITTGPPHSTHLIGLELSEKFNLKWISDFRDPWKLFYNKKLFRTIWAKKRDSNLERKVLNGADAVITTVGGKLHKELDAVVEKKQKFVSIPNGYDHQLMRDSKAILSTKFQIVYCGLLTHNQDFMSIIKVLEMIQSKHPYEIQLTLAGSIKPNIIKIFKRRLKSVEVRYLGYLEHHKVISLIKGANLLLVFPFRESHKQMISGKLLECLASGVPVIFLGKPTSVATRLIQQSPESYVFKSNNYLAIQKHILYIFGAWKSNKPIKSHFKEILNYSRVVLTDELEKTLLSI